MAKAKEPSQPKKMAETGGDKPASKDEIKKRLQEALKRTQAARNPEGHADVNAKVGGGPKQQVSKGRIFRHQGR